MKNFKIKLSFKDDELVIEGHTARVISIVDNKEDIARCIKNYIKIYVEGEVK